MRLTVSILDKLTISTGLKFERKKKFLHFDFNIHLGGRQDGH